MTSWEVIEIWLGLNLGCVVMHLGYFLASGK